MCFFDQTRWACGFWRWGNLRQQCTKEHRIGETCGLKLIFETDQRHGHCKTCEQVIRKQRRITKMKKDIARWRREGSRPATIEKTERDVVEVQRSISTLWEQHSKQHVAGSDPRHKVGRLGSLGQIGVARVNPPQLLHRTAADQYWYTDAKGTSPKGADSSTATKAYVSIVQVSLLVSLGH